LNWHCFQLAIEKTCGSWPCCMPKSAARTRLSVASEALQ
jgi:hypothetical protein